MPSVCQRIRDGLLRRGVSPRQLGLLAVVGQHVVVLDALRAAEQLMQQPPAAEQGLSQLGARWTSGLSACALEVSGTVH